MKKLMKLAAKQHGAFGRRQAIALGLTPIELKAALRAGTIERAVRGVYRVTGSVDTWRQRLMIAVLAAGPGAAASGRAAAALHRMRGYREGAIEVLQPRRPSRRYKVADEHSSRFLPEHHVCVVDGIPVTTVVRTTFDLCSRAFERRAKWIIKAVVGDEQTTFVKLGVVLTELAVPGRAGVQLFRMLLTTLDDDAAPPTESELEDLVLAVLRRAGLPLPSRQVEVAGTTAPIGRIDFLYREAWFVIDADSKRWHNNWLANEADQRRDKLLIAAGYQITRTNWHELIEEPELLVNAVRAVLSRAA